MNATPTGFKALAENIYEWMLEIRHHLHAHPELSFQEHETSGYIASKLDEMGIPYKKGFAETGILARIEGQAGAGRCIALRADMDALPVTEESGCEFVSEKDGVMHACGHDIHVTSLLGTARILNEFRAQLKGTVLLIFQPGEELLPGGAKLMMEQGVFDEFKPELILGQHVQPNIPTGIVAFRPGMYMASSDEIYLTVKGKGGHGAMPHQLADPVIAMAQILVALQQIVSRNANVMIPTVLSFGKLIANGATNVIPSEVKAEGTFRTMNEQWRAEAHRRMQSIASGVAEGLGCSANLHVEHGYPVVVNHEASTEQAIKFAREINGSENVRPLDLRMTSEDFAYFGQKYPAVFYRLGVEPENGISHPLHSSKFVANERALITGASTMAWLAWNFMESR
jgi:amidohydrolase